MPVSGQMVCHLRGIDIEAARTASFQHGGAQTEQMKRWRNCRSIAASAYYIWTKRLNPIRQTALVW